MKAQTMLVRRVGLVGLLLAVLLSSRSLFATSQFGTESILPIPSSEDRAAIETNQRLAEQVSALEWLGPLAPIAISPFFGLACLSGIATYGPEWLQQRSSLFSEASPLNSPALFWTMLVLTIVTSLPRLSKVSKPLALIAEKLEAYSAIIVLIALKVLSAQASAPSEVDPAAPAIALAGIGSVSTDILFAIASFLNIVAINTVKLFCELLVWLVPVPLIDAMIEAFCKSTCAVLLGIYCWSPLVATIINAILFAVCAFAYFWVRRRMAFYFEMIARPWLDGWFANSPQDSTREQVVFLAHPWRGLPQCTKLYMTRHNGEGWRLVQRGWISTREYRLPPCEPVVSTGILSDVLELRDDEGNAIGLLIRRLGKVAVAPGM